MRESVLTKTGHQSVTFKLGEQVIVNDPSVNMKLLAGIIHIEPTPISSNYPLYTLIALEDCYDAEYLGVQFSILAGSEFFCRQDVLEEVIVRESAF
jgi:hypothetical protein